MKINLFSSSLACLLLMLTSHAYGQNHDVAKTTELLSAIAMQSNIAEQVDKICPPHNPPKNIAEYVRSEIKEIPKLTVIFTSLLEQTKPIAVNLAKSMIEQSGGCNTEKHNEVLTMVENQNNKLLLRWFQKDF